MTFILRRTTPGPDNVIFFIISQPSSFHMAMRMATFFRREFASLLLHANSFDSMCQQFVI